MVAAMMHGGAGVLAHAERRWDEPIGRGVGAVWHESLMTSGGDTGGR